MLLRQDPLVLHLQHDTMHGKKKTGGGKKKGNNNQALILLMGAQQPSWLSYFLLNFPFG